MSDLRNDFLGTLVNCTKLVDLVVLAPSAYTAYSLCGASFESWTIKDFCNFYESTTCTSEAVSFYSMPSIADCPPACLRGDTISAASASSAAYCQTFALFSLGCRHTGKQMSDVNNLVTDCLTSYGNSLSSQTFMDFALQFNITNIDIAALQSALSDPTQEEEAKRLISLSLAASSGLPSVTLFVSDIVLLDDMNGFLRKRSLIDSNLGIATVTVGAKIIAEGYGAFSDTARAAAHITRSQIKQSLSKSTSTNNNNTNSLFISRLRDYCDQELDTFFVLNKLKKSDQNSKSFVTAETSNDDAGRIEVKIQFERTASPTIVPTLLPSSPPSSTPSTQPSSPTNTPTVIPSTLTPTTSFSRINIVINMGGILCETFDDIYYEVLKESIAYVGTLPMRYIESSNCAGSRRLLEQIASVHANTANTGVQLSTAISSTSEVISSSTPLIINSVSAGQSFIDLLITAVDRMNGNPNPLVSAYIISVSVIDTTPTQSPAGSPPTAPPNPVTYSPSKAPTKDKKGKGKDDSKKKKKKNKDTKDPKDKDSKGKGKDLKGKDDKYVTKSPNKSKEDKKKKGKKREKH